MTKKVTIGKKILSANEQYAQRNRQLLEKLGISCLNFISSPGSGKTTLLARTITDLKGKIAFGVIEGDIETDIDAQKIRATSAPVIQINTEGACHLAASQIARGLNELPVDKLDLICIENVGNLVCPSAFELGETGKIALLSVAEGDDKPAKYPALFARAKAVLITKADFMQLEHIQFDIQRVISDIRRVNKDAPIFEVSSVTGQGMSVWYDWLIEFAKRGI